jgi:bleomycin hydrolase
MKKILFITGLSLLQFAASAQIDVIKSNKKGSNYRFNTVKQLDASEVKNQGSTGTCWSFSAESFLESEILRAGKQPVDLAEMWIARNAYFDKAVNYVRMQGKTNFGQGGEPHDVINMARKYGVVPQSVYGGLMTGEKRYDHTELEGILKAYCDAVVKTAVDGKALSKNWQNGINGILDAYLGKSPDKFTYGGKEFTPKSFSESLGLNFDDYIEITSFTHHPFYSQFVIEIPDNWAAGQAYNVPLAELEAIADNAIANNYSIEWASDVSEKYFSHKNGLAIVPEKEWSDLRAGERDSVWLNPTKERAITQEMRQEAFDAQTTQDDHGMHITGMVSDQNGSKYYVVKNSWGADSNEMGGQFYCSKAYFRFKTTGIMVNKKAIPKDLAKKMGV